MWLFEKFLLHDFLVSKFLNQKTVLWSKLFAFFFNAINYLVILLWKFGEIVPPVLWSNILKNFVTDLCSLEFSIIMVRSIEDSIEFSNCVVLVECSEYSKKATDLLDGSKLVWTPTLISPLQAIQTKYPHQPYGLIPFGPNLWLGWISWQLV